MARSYGLASEANAKDGTDRASPSSLCFETDSRTQQSTGFAVTTSSSPCNQNRSVQARMTSTLVLSLGLIGETGVTASTVHNGEIRVCRQSSKSGLFLSYTARHEWKDRIQHGCDD